MTQTLLLRSLALALAAGLWSPAARAQAADAVAQLAKRPAQFHDLGGRHGQHLPRVGPCADSAKWKAL